MHGKSAWVVATWAVLFGSAAALAADPSYEPTSHYKVREIHGWKVYVHRSLFGEHEQLGERALALLRAKLFDVVRLVPESRLQKLRDVPIWLEHHNPRTSSAQYHPSRQWLVEHDFNPDKARAVEIARARRFLKEQRRQPFMVLHELAHAYHHRVLSFENRRIKQAYQRAVESGGYRKVLNYHGRTVEHYALTNHKEFFAELTECYFGTNDFYPFVRPELRVHDPETFHLLGEIWGE